jgi:hypothetical protein
MVAVMTELMVGGERSAQDDSIKGSARTLVSKLRLRALLQATARTHLSLTTSSPLLTDTLTQTFFIHQLFPCSQTADHTFEQLQLRSGLVLVATLCSHWRIPDALLSCHRYGEIQAPVQSNLATCQIQRSAAARRFRSEQTGSKVRIARDSPGSMCWSRKPCQKPTLRYG